MCFAETHQCALLEFRTHNNNKWRKQESARRQWLILHMYVVASGEAKAIEYYTVIQQWERSIDIVAEERFLVLLSLSVKNLLVQNFCYNTLYSLFVFSINGLKQNARSLLTQYSNTDFYTLLCGSLHFVLHGSTKNHLFQRF